MNDNIYLNQILISPYLEEESVSILLLLAWPEIAYLAKLISDNFWSFDRGQDSRQGFWNEPVRLV